MKYVKRMLCLIVVMALVSGCASMYKEARERETTFFQIKADSSRANTALDLRGEKASLDELARAYSEINRAATERERVEAEKLLIASEERKFRELVELLKQSPEVAGVTGNISYSDRTLAQPLFNGAIRNDSKHTLYFKIFHYSQLMATTPSVSPNEFTPLISLPEGEYLVQAYKTYNDGFYASYPQTVDGLDHEVKHRGKDIGWLGRVY